MIRKNDATINRPDGERVLDAPYVVSDIESMAGTLQSEVAWQKNERNAITIYKSGPLTQVLVCVHAGGLLSENYVDGIVGYHVLQGAVDVTMQTETVSLQSNQVIHISKGLYHEVMATEDSILLLSNFEIKDQQ